MESGHHSSPLRTPHALRHNGDGQTTPTRRENSTEKLSRTPQLSRNSPTGRPKSSRNIRATMLHPRSNRQSPPLRAQNQSQTGAIRIHGISHKTNTRTPNQSQTFARFASCVLCGTSHFQYRPFQHFESSQSTSRAGPRFREFLSGTDLHSTRAHLHETKRENIF